MMGALSDSPSSLVVDTHLPISMTTAGAPLQAAAVTFQNYLDSYGVPPHSANNPNVAAFQQAWNADAVAVASLGMLDVDGAYGTNTSHALNALTGLAQPPAGVTPVVPPKPGPIVPPKPAAAAGSIPWGEIALVGGVLTLGYFLFFRKKKGKKPPISITNPRRGRGRRRASLLA